MTYEYRILQTPIANPWCFRSFSEAMECKKFNRNNYVSVWSGNVEAGSINEALYKLDVLFNADDRPNGKHSRSLSMSDIVTLNGVPYYCDSVGYSEISKEKW